MRLPSPTPNGQRHQPMVVTLDARGMVAAVAEPWDEAPIAGQSYLVSIGRIAGSAGGDEQAAMQAAIADVSSGRVSFRSIELSDPLNIRLVITARTIGKCDGVIVSHIDISEERKRAAELGDVERRLNEIYSIADIGDFEYVAAQDATRLSPPVLRMFGLASDASGKSHEFFSSLHPDDRQRVVTLHQDPSWRQIQFDFRIVRPDGEIRNIAASMRREFDAKGYVSRIFGIDHDVTARRQAEERLDRLFEASIDILTIISFRGFFKRVNPAFAAALGYSEEELCARPAVEFVHPEDRDSTMAAVQAQLYSGDKRRIENRYICKNGSIVRFSWTMSPSGRDILGVARDITAEHEAAEELRRAKDSAEAASNAKSDFLATMSHEIRTPLNGVIGTAELLRSGALTPDQKHHVETIHESGQLLLTLLNDILDLSRIEAGKLEIEERAFDLHHALISAVELWQPAAQAKGLALACKLAPGLSRTVSGDEMRVRQIVSNLISNAIKFTTAGDVVLTAGGNSEGISIHVRDTGCGIERKVLPKLFQKFSQGDASVTRRHGGTGLGLAICKHLAEMMGGSIDVDSEQGTGSTFVVKLALREVSVSANPKATPSIASERSASLHLLVAEDNAVNRKLIAHMLEALGHGCDFAEDGEQAVARASECSYDAILMDVQMPVLDGISAARRIRALSGAVAGTYIIAVTANAMTGDNEKYLAAGMDSYVSKPISMGDLARALDGVRAAKSAQTAVA